MLLATWTLDVQIITRITLERVHAVACCVLSLFIVGHQLTLLSLFLFFLFFPSLLFLLLFFSPSAHGTISLSAAKKKALFEQVRVCLLLPVRLPYAHDSVVQAALESQLCALESAALPIFIFIEQKNRSDQILKRKKCLLSTSIDHGWLSATFRPLESKALHAGCVFIF